MESLSQLKAGWKSLSVVLFALCLASAAAAGSRTDGEVIQDTARGAAKGAVIGGIAGDAGKGAAAGAIGSVMIGGMRRNQ